MQKPIAFLLSFLLFVVLILVGCKSTNKEKVAINDSNNIVFNDSTPNYQEYIKQNYKVFPMPMPKELTLCGDRVPLERIHVRENLDREILVNTYWHSNTFLYQKRAARWFPTIERILKQQDVPDDLKYIALIESGLTDAVSPSGASGFWQFMKPTGGDYGLEINQYVDERYHIEKATIAACQYMKAAYKQFGNWSSAAASYNIGKGALSRAMKKQKVDSYFDLHLNSETARYVYRILAAKLIISNSKDFGFNFRRQDYYLPYRTYKIEVDSTINDLPQFAISQGINYQMLRLLNPWIRNYSLPNKEGKTYKILMPKGNFDLPQSDSIVTNTSAQK